LFWMNEHLMLMAEIEKARLSRERWERAREEESPRTNRPWFGRLRALIERAGRHRPRASDVGHREDRMEL